MIRIKKYGKDYNVETGGYGSWIRVPSATSIALRITQNPWLKGVQKIILDEIIEG